MVGRMIIRLPSFSATECRFLSACGQVATDQSKVLKWLRGQKTLEAKYRRSGCTSYVRVMFGGETGGHLHVDAAARGYFLKNRRSCPRPTHKVAEVREALGRVAGYDISSRIVGAYFVDQKKLPPFVQSTIAETTSVRDVSIKTTGGTLSVTGAPINSIRWWLREDQDDAFVQLEAEKTFALDEGYLEECLDVLDSAFEAFVLQGEK